MTEVALFASTYVLVLALGLQSLNVNGGHYVAAFLTSFVIGAANLVLFKLAPDAGPSEIAAYLAGGPLGIVTAMRLHPRLRGRWRRTQSQADRAEAAEESAGRTLGPLGRRVRPTVTTTKEKRMSIYVHWERPRRWAIRLYKPSPRGGGYHTTIGVLAESVDRAIEAAQRAYPEHRIESANDTGVVDIVVDAPVVDLTPNDTGNGPRQAQLAEGPR